MLKFRLGGLLEVIIVDVNILVLIAESHIYIVF